MFVGWPTTESSSVKPGVKRANLVSRGQTWCQEGVTLVSLRQQKSVGLGVGNCRNLLHFFLFSYDLLIKLNNHFIISLEVVLCNC